MLMKNAHFYLRLALLTGSLFFMPLWSSLAADTNANALDATVSQPAATTAPVVSKVAAPLKLPYGVDDVLKLSRAQIGEQIIVNYVQSSGTVYNLASKDIVYLKTQGVSDNVISAMLTQRSRLELAAQSAQAHATTAPNGPPPSDATTVPTVPSYFDSNAAYAEAPLTPPTSSTYVIPYSAANPYYGPYSYSYSPYADWGPYYGGYWGPSVAFGFGFGGRGVFRDGRAGFHGGHGSFAGRGGGGGGFRGGGGGGFRGGGGGGFRGGGGGGFRGGGGGGSHGGGGHGR